MQETILQINKQINDIIWGPAVLILFVAVGAYFSIRTNFLQLTKIKLIWQNTLGSIFKSKNKTLGGISPFAATATALAGTMGTGNIVGIATALALGGVGAIFWMWVSAFFGMMTKYAEIVLAVKYRQKNENGEYIGGPMYYIQNGLNQKIPAILFSIFCVLASYGIGNMTQINSISQSLNNTFNIPYIITGIVIAGVIFAVIIGGVKRIASFTTAIIPILSIFYLVGCAVALALNFEKIPDAFSMIISEAFNMQSLGGGIFGYVMVNAMKYGFSRGVFSNEAGLGSAPIIHAATQNKEPAKQGMWGIFEVFVDTIIVCTLTALVIITSGAMESGENGAALTTLAFESTLGSFAGIFISISITLFAFSTIISWSFYGEKSIEYLWKNKKAVLIYRLSFVLCVVIGAVLELKTVWEISDTLNGFMALSNMYAIILLSKTVIECTKSYLDKRKHHLKSSEG